MSEDAAPDEADELRAQIDAARAHLAATAEALAARVTPPAEPPRNLPVPYRAPEVRRSVTVAGVVAGVSSLVVLAFRLRRRR